MNNTKERIRNVTDRVLTLLKWILFAGITGAVLGVVGAYFARSITFVTELRTNNPWILYLLPFVGLLIVFIYKFELHVFLFYSLGFSLLSIYTVYMYIYLFGA